jgi:hypothetical protein
VVVAAGSSLMVFGVEVRCRAGVAYALQQTDTQDRSPLSYLKHVLDQSRLAKPSIGGTTVIVYECRL